MGAGSRSKSTGMLADSVGEIAARSSTLPLPVVSFGIFFVLVVATVVYGWHRFGRSVVTRPIYRLSAENIRISAPPPWIRTDVRAEVVRDAALDDLTIFDKDVTIRVYQAFELHPWVANVRRVSKQPPAQLDVELEFRRPVAWVEVPPGVLPGNEGGVIPVDRDGVVLPSRDFTQEHVADYLRISVPGVSACGLAGSAWGDERVTGAARIAASLREVWQDWKLFRIRVSTDPNIVRLAEAPIFEIETQSQARIIWGRAPTSEPTTEPSPVAKLARLRQLFQNAKTADITADTVWDLRTVDVIRTHR